MTELEQLRAWSYRRQHLDRSGAGPMAALERVLAVHSTHPPAPLSLLARTRGFDYSAFEEIEREKLAVSFPVMRGSVHQLPTKFAPMMFAATSGRNEQFITRRLGSDANDNRSFDELRRVLLPLLHEPVAGSGIRETLGITEREFLAIRLMTRTGEVLRLSTNPRSDRLLYVGTVAWLGKPLQEVDAREAKGWLARGYFDAFGPARLKDFAWWFSASQKDARAAMDAVDLVDTGDGLPLILRGGRAVARWSHRFSGKTMHVTVSQFPGEKVDVQEITTRLEEVAGLMACQEVVLSIAPV